MLETTSFAITPSTEQTEKPKMFSVHSIQSYEWNGSVLTGTLSKGEFCLYLLNDRMMRFIWNPFGPVDKSSSIAVSLNEQTITGELTDTEKYLLLQTGIHEVVLTKDEFSITVKKEGKIVFQTSSPALYYTSKNAVYLSVEKNSKAPIYGLGEKTGFIDKNGSKISNWNTDVYSPHNKDTVELYQTIPLVFIHEGQRTNGIFFDNSYRTEFDMQTYKDKLTIMAEGGQVNAYFLLAEDLKQAVTLYTDLTGKTPLPPKWALGYHQSRYSYSSQKEVMDLINTFDEYEIPIDAVFLDIHYMDEFRVFTFDEERFPKPQKLMEDLSKRNIDVVPIVDPGVKKDVDYNIYQEGVENNYFCKKLEGDIYYGEVWPGMSAFPDFFNRKVQKWWGNLHQFYTKLGIRGIWNDMNEPSVFNETKTMDLDVVHNYDGKKITHREGHNLYGLFMSKATFEGLQSLLDNTRPFVLTRAGYAGIQRYAAVWTGDNRSHWEHLEMSLPMIMNLGMSGITFTGADVGGFSSDTTPELLIRWTQVGAFMPYFRNHSVQDAIRQEPWAFGKETMTSIKKYIELRYRFLPYIYTLFYESEQTGVPVVRPLVMEYPKDEKTYQCSDQFLVGSQLLIAPILRPGQTHRAVYLPEGDWYDFWTEEKYVGGRHYLVEADIDTLPIFVKAGTILPLGTPVRNTKEEQEIELNVYYSDKEENVGHLYEDDGYSYNYKDNEYQFTTFKLDHNHQIITDRSGSFSKATSITKTNIIGEVKTT